MSRISDFIFANWRTLTLIYTIGAAVVFVGVLFFFWWICRLEDKERELCRYEDEANGRMTAVISVFIAIPCALMWCVIPLIIVRYGYITGWQRDSLKLWGIWQMILTMKKRRK